MKRSGNKFTAFVCLFVLFAAGIKAQDLKITTNLPESISPGQTIDADITINKGSISSFAKFQLDLPLGYTAQAIDIKGGNWTFDNQRAKIVWVSVPADPSFTVKMKLTAPASSPAVNVVTGKFFYLESNVKKEYDMPAHTFKSGGGVASTNTVTTTNTETVTSTPTNTVATTNTVTSTETNTVTSTPTNTVSTTNTNTVTSTPTNTVATTNSVSTTNTNTVTSTPTNTVSANNNNTSSNISSAGMVYRVQIGAFSNKPAKGKFPSVKEFWIYEDNGLFKATAGKFGTVNEAEAYKDQLKSMGLQGFVVAFQNGVRVKFP